MIGKKIDQRIDKYFFEFVAEYAEKLFDMVDNFAESSKRKAAVWPLQIMLLILCPVRLYHRTVNIIVSYC